MFLYNYNCQYPDIIASLSLIPKISFPNTIDDVVLSSYNHRTMPMRAQLSNALSCFDPILSATLSDQKGT